MESDDREKRIKRSIICLYDHQRMPTFINYYYIYKENILL